MSRGLLTTLIVILAVMLTAPIGAQVEVRKIDLNLAMGNATRVEVDLTVGSLRIEGKRGSTAEVEVRFECSKENLAKCRRRAERLHLAPRIDGKTLNIRLRRTSRARLQGIKSHMLVRIPKDLPVEVDTRAASVTVEGMRSHLELDSLEGNVKITYPKKAVQSVKVAIGVGRADLWVDDTHIEGAGFPRSVDWQGTGNSRIEVDLGTGDVEIRLK